MNNIEFLRANGVDIENSVNTLGLDLYNETLNVFLSEIVDKTNKLKECLMANNMKDYATYVHAIKGECSYLGFTELTKQALDHQLKSQAGDAEYIRNNYVTLLTEIGRVIKVARIYLGLE